MIVLTITDKDGNVETLKTSKTKLTVGSSYTDDITILNPIISPEHGVFHISKMEVVYTDNGYGTSINEREILGKSTSVSLNDIVRIGEVTITYTLEHEDVPNQEVLTNREDVRKTSSRSMQPKTIRNAPAFFQQTGPVQPRFPRLAELLNKVFSITQKTPTREPGPIKPMYPFLSNLEEKLSAATEEDSAVDYHATAVVIAILMVVFWPVGLVANLIAWYQGYEEFSHKEEYDPDFGCITTLLSINCLFVAMILFILGTLLVLKISM